MKLRIATRRSPLALWQANEVAARLSAAHPGLKTELIPTDTAPDLDLSRSIGEIGGKGAFSKEIQALVLAGAADLAVHSAKDLQAVTPAGLVIAAFLERGRVEDCLVGSRLRDLGPGATVATGSNRRRVLLLDIRPDLEVVDLRGNIATRLSRIGEVDAIVMAEVALERLGLHPEIVESLDAESFVPQVGQGALAVECLADDGAAIEILAAIDHVATRATVSAERSFLATLGGDCDLPAGAHATLGSDGKLTIRGILADEQPSGSTLWRADVVDLPSADPGRTLAQRLRTSGPPGP